MAHNKNASEASYTAEIEQGLEKNENAAAKSESIVQGVVNEENNASDIKAQIPLQRVLHTIVGLTRTQCVTAAADGYEDFTDFDNLQWDSIKKKTAARKINLNRGGFYVSAAKEKMIQALSFWVNN